MKVFYRSQFDEPVRFISCAGSPIKIIYTGHYDENGVFDLIEKGKTNIYREIQTHADSVDLHVILARYENGDLSALNQIAGSYGDFTEMPSNYADMLNLLIAKRDEFMSLKPEIRERFGNDFNRYMATAGSVEWFKNLGAFDVSKPDVSVDNNVVDNSDKRVGDTNE